MKRITLDFETRSKCDLKKCGAYKYSLDSSTQPTCLAIKERGSSHTFFFTYQQINRPWSALPKSFRSYWIRCIKKGYEFSAHNAFFETCIYENILVKRYFWPKISVRQWRCTAAKAAACSLPRALEGAGAAMKLSTQKDKMGYVAMMATCKPTKNYNAWKKAKEKVDSGARVTERTRKKALSPAPPVFLEYEHNPKIWETLYHYCKIDVIAEELLDESLPDLLPIEQEIWFLNQRLNWRGLKIDIPTTKKIVSIMAIESKEKLEELDELTLGLVTKPGARQSILEFLELEDIVLPDIRAKTVEDVLKNQFISDDMRRLLEIRQALSKTSTKKYQSFIDRCMSDDRARDITLYHGAVPTGRDTGSGIQPHNFPRGILKIDPKRPYATIENIVDLSHDELKLLYGESLPMVFSSILRNMIIPDDGYDLFVADFSKIEVAVLWWLSENKDGLEILRKGLDPYIYMAAFNTGRAYEDFDDHSPERQLGKAQVLGCGFGMGWGKFLSSAFDQYRLKLTEGQSKEAVYNYRTANAPVVTLWSDYEKAWISAVEDGKVVTVGKCKFFCSKGFLWIKLPSGRKLAYPGPGVEWVEKTFGTERKAVKSCYYMGLSKSKKTLEKEYLWGGKITENIVQAVARDLMMHATLRLEKKKYQPLLMVHDEGLCQRRKGKGSVKEFVGIMCERPPWVDKFLPLDAKGWIGPRYRK